MVDITQITPAQRQIKCYGWIRDLPDPRRPRFRVNAPITNLPEKFSLRDKMPPLYDQQALGSCTGNALAAAIAYDRAKQNCSPLWTPSRLFIYFNERVIENTVSADSGAAISDGIKTLARVGVCDEALWPYDITKFTNTPPDAVYAQAAKSVISNYGTVPQTHQQIKQCLFVGFPIVFGFVVWQSFEGKEVAATGIVPMPDIEREHQLGGHCVVCTGWDDERQLYECRNSWSSNWGDGGYFWMPWDYLVDSDYCSDFWQIDTVSG